MTTRTLIVAALIVLGTSCSASTEPTEPPEPFRLAVMNELDMSLTLRVGANVLGTIGGFDSVSVTLPPTVRSLEWQSQKRQYSDGSPLPDELAGTTVSVSSRTQLVTITNTVNGTTYFTPNIFVPFADTIAFEIARGSNTLCLGWTVGPTSFLGIQWGYYRLEPGTELRYYRGRSCRAAAAPYRFWSFSQLSGAAIGSGKVALNADVLP